MGTRGAFGVIIGEKEKIAYNHFDSYPEGKGVEVLGWLRNVIADDNLPVVMIASYPFTDLPTDTQFVAELEPPEEEEE